MFFQWVHLLRSAPSVKGSYFRTHWNTSKPVPFGVGRTGTWLQQQQWLTLVFTNVSAAFLFFAKKERQILKNVHNQIWYQYFSYKNKNLSSFLTNIIFYTTKLYWHKCQKFGHLDFWIINIFINAFGIVLTSSKVFALFHF